MSRRFRARLALSVLALAALSAGCDEPSPGGAFGAAGPGGALNAAAVPTQVASWIAKAGSLCPQVSAPLLAAQLHQESGFNPGAVSPAGAQGIAQFMPGTWPSWAQDDDGSGTASPFDPGDAIMAQGRMMCSLAAAVAADLVAGKLKGDPTALALAAYNAGLGAVQAAGGVPAFAETQAYGPAILAAVARYAAASPPAAPAGGDLRTSIITALKAKLGTPYAYGGGTVTGPSLGQYGGTVGWDCSSFVQYGVYQGTGGKITLPRTAAAQGARFAANAEPLEQAAPGDLILYGGSSFATAGHVTMYAGNGMMLEEPHTGAVAQYVPVYQSSLIGVVHVPYEQMMSGL